MGQQGFPLRPGDWEGTTAVQGMKEPMVIHLCINDAEWYKALAQNRVCKMDQLAVNSKGASYGMSCDMKIGQMKGTIDLKFDGMEHMTGTAAMTMTMNARAPMAITTVTDYRWKSSQCNASDVNTRKK